MEKELINKIKDGDQQAFELLYRRYYKRMCVFAFKFLRQEDLAEEVVQEVFLNIWKNKAKIRTNTSFQSYLFQSVQNRSINCLEHEKIKKNYAEVMMVAYQDGFNTENTDSLLNQELEQLVNSTLENLPPKCRQIFIMSRFEGKKYNEIADELSISVKTVETQIGRALSVFRKALSAYLSVLLLMLVK